MLHKCANKDCLNLFRSMSRGKLFHVEQPARTRPTTMRKTQRFAAPGIFLALRRLLVFLHLNFCRRAGVSRSSGAQENGRADFWQRIFGPKGPGGRRKRMLSFIIHFCTICGRQKIRPDWFLIAENRWEDKLKILQWEDRIAGTSGIQAVCGTEHARELVVHWMRTSSLNYPLAQTQSFVERPAQRMIRAAKGDPDVSGARQLGELYVDRGSIGRIMDENPDSLTPILDELVLALREENEAVDAEAAEIAELDLQLSRY